MLALWLCPGTTWGRGAAWHLPPRLPPVWPPPAAGEKAPAAGPVEEARRAAHQMIAAVVAAASWRWLEAWGPRMGTPGGDVMQGGRPIRIRDRVLGVRPHPGEAVCVGLPMGRTIKPCGPVSRGGHGGEGRKKRARAMGVHRLREAGRLPAGSCLPRLLEEGSAQALAAACCPKNQQLHLFILRGYTFIILFTRLVCEPSGCTLLILIVFSATARAGTSLSSCYFS